MGDLGEVEGDQLELVLDGQILDLAGFGWAIAGCRKLDVPLFFQLRFDSAYGAFVEFPSGLLESRLREAPIPSQGRLPELGG